MSTESNRQIKLGATLSYFILFFNIICGLLYTPWMIRKIGTDDYGLYILVTSFLNYFVIDFGIWQAVTKIISRKRAESDDEGIKNVLGITTKLYVALDLVVICVLLIVYPNIGRFFNNLNAGQLASLKVVYCIAALFSVLSFPFGFVKGVFVSHEFFIQTKLFDLLVKVFIIIFTVIALSLGGGVYALVFCYGLVPFIINVSRALFLRKKGIRINIKAYSKSVLKEIFTVSWWLLVIVFAELFINNISPIILAARSTLQQVSVFGIGMTIYSYFYSFAAGLNGLFVPKVTDYKVSGEPDQIHHLTCRIGRVQGIILGAILGGFIVCGQEFLGLWVGSDFNRSYYVAIAIMTPQLIIAMLNIETVNLLVSDKLKYQAVSMLLTAALSVTASYLLSPVIGASGAALAIGISNTIFMIILMTCFYKRHSSFSIKKFTKEVSPVLLVLLLSVIAVLLLDRLFVFDSILVSLIVKGAIFVVLYVSSMFFVANQYEKEFVYRTLGKLKLLNKR